MGAHRSLVVRSGTQDTVTSSWPGRGPWSLWFSPFAVHTALPSTPEPLSLVQSRVPLHRVPYGQRGLGTLWVLA